MSEKQLESTPSTSTKCDTPNRCPAFVSTPISRFTAAQSGTSSKNNTPRENCTTNPFESYLLDRLNTNTYSPSIFARVVSPNVGYILFIKSAFFYTYIFSISISASAARWLLIVAELYDLLPFSSLIQLLNNTFCRCL